MASSKNKHGAPERGATSAPAQPVMPKWKMKAGVGTHTMSDGETVSPGQVISAWPDDLAGVEDKFVCLTPAADLEPKVEATLTAVHRGHGKYDVVNMVTGEVLNTAPLTKAEAEGCINGNAPSITFVEEGEEQV
jgi:hypothetical protein